MAARLTIWVDANVTARQVLTRLPGVTSVAGSVAFRSCAFVDVNATLPVRVESESATTGALQTVELDLALVLTGNNLGDVRRTSGSVNNVAQPGFIFIFLENS